MEKKKCKVCQEDVFKIKSKRTLNGKMWVYVDSLGSPWSGNTCPKCRRIKKNAKRQKPLKIKHCLKCANEFKTKSASAKFCSTSCRVMHNRKVYKKNCYKCNKEFETTISTKLACKPNHSPSMVKSNKKSKAIRKGKIKQKISKYYKNELNSIYELKGSHQVDHIIPLNHPDVCGLHVPWNLQYLSLEDNKLKSNQWDWTMDNNTWK